MEKTKVNKETLKEDIKKQFLDQLSDCIYEKIRICGRPFVNYYDFLHRYYKRKPADFFYKRYELKNCEDAAVVAQNDLVYNNECRDEFRLYCDAIRKQFTASLACAASDGCSVELPDPDEKYEYTSASPYRSIHELILGYYERMSDEDILAIQDKIRERNAMEVVSDDVWYDEKLNKQYRGLINKRRLFDVLNAFYEDCYSYIDDMSTAFEMSKHVRYKTILESALGLCGGYDNADDAAGKDTEARERLEEFYNEQPLEFFADEEHDYNVEFDDLIVNMYYDYCSI